ncbi:hypothetical protein F66182_8268 [Fusarium sp. NRRL 66182]|nr:hypothetical protein F66182_8268 [Fusarium sp. NRRL 66182]
MAPNDFYDASAPLVSDGDAYSSPEIYAVSPSDNSPSPPKVGYRFTRETSSKLKDWYAGHLECPYPTEEEKLMLEDASGLTRTQINTWLANARRRWSGNVSKARNIIVGREKYKPGATHIPTQALTHIPQSTISQRNVDTVHGIVPHQTEARAGTLCSGTQGAFQWDGQPWGPNGGQVSAKVQLAPRPAETFVPNDFGHLALLDLELKRWVMATMSPYNPTWHVPSDNELRHQARCLLYNDDDPLNPTAADNAQWLGMFKQSVGII